MFRDATWEVGVEVSFSIWGERGRIDVLAFHRPTGTLAVVEVKSVVPDSQEAIGVLDVKVRLAPQIARNRGWHPASVARILVIGDSPTARRRVDELGETYGSAFPVRGRDVGPWIRNPSFGPISGLMFLSYGTGGVIRRPPTGRQRVRRPSAGSR